MTTGDDDDPSRQPPASGPGAAASAETPPLILRLTYPDAPESLIHTWMRRRKRMLFGPGEGLPPADADLAPLLAARIPSGEPPLPHKPSLHGMKLREMRVELAGRSELAALNAILIAHLRKARWPDQAPRLFNRIWREHGEALMRDLPGRWLISSVITFADHGETEAQRRIGVAMNVFFSLMKLYEFERMHSRAAPETPFPLRRTKGRRLPLDMPRFSLADGGLDINLMAQLWRDARDEPVAGRLACHLLDRLNADPSNLFRRITLMRDSKRAALRGKADAGPAPDEDPPEADDTAAEE